MQSSPGVPRDRRSCFPFREGKEAFLSSGRANSSSTCLFPPSSRSYCQGGPRPWPFVQPSAVQGHSRAQTIERYQGTSIQTFLNLKTVFSWGEPLGNSNLTGEPPGHPHAASPSPCHPPHLGFLLQVLVATPPPQPR